MSIIKTMVQNEITSLKVAKYESNQAAQSTNTTATKQLVYLKVPIVDRKKCKLLGGEYDKKLKCYYIPAYITDHAPFSKWIVATKNETSETSTSSDTKTKFITEENSESDDLYNTSDGDDENASSNDSDGHYGSDEEQHTSNKKKSKHVLVNEEDDVNAWSYNAFLLACEKKYPFDKSSKRYRNRYSLLGPRGRFREYVRRLFAFHGDKTLFDSLWVEWYEYAKMLAGESFKKVSIDLTSKKITNLQIPALHYDLSDVKQKLKDGESEDLLPFSKTLEFLPTDLQVSLTLKEAGIPFKTIIEYTNHFIYYYRVKHLSANESVDHIPKEAIMIQTAKQSTKINFNKQDEMNDSDDEQSNDDDSLLSDSESDSSTTPSKHTKTLKFKNQSKLDEYSFRSVLGDTVINSFSEEIQSTMSLTRVKRRLPRKDLDKALDRVSKSITSFKGDVEKAPTFLYEYCLAVQRYNFEVGDALELMRTHMKGEALEWFLQVTKTVKGMDPNDVMPQVIALFRAQYMNEVHIENLRSDLRAVSLSMETKKGLKDHYEIFMKKVNALTLMDNSFTVKTRVRMFLESLTKDIRIYIGESWHTCSNVDKLFQLAEAAVDVISRSKGRKQQISLNAGEMKNNNDKKSDSKKKKKNELEKWGCFHCGRKNHYVSECWLYRDGKPQSTKGAELFAKFCETVNKDYEYDPKKYFRKSKRSEDDLSSRTSKPDKQHTPTRKQKEHDNEKKKNKNQYARKSYKEDSPAVSEAEEDEHENTQQ